ncbi:MAG: rod shape-determining protein RodA [Rhodospirillales bacterium]
MFTERRLLRAEPDFGLLTKLLQINWLYVLLLCALAGTGYVALYSAGGGPEPYAARHFLRFAFGLVMALSLAMVDIRLIARFSWPFYAVALVLLILTLRVGHVGKGAERWLELGPVQLQPSELMKVALAMALAAWFQRASWEKVGNPLFLIPPAVAVALPVGLILKEPNLGTAVITAVIGAAIFVGAGMRLWQIGLLLLPTPFLAEFAYHHLHDYQRARITTFFNPESDPLGAGYNIIQSKIALGSGGLWGKGFMQGTQAHLNFLPEKQTDFVFSIIAEEWGLVGALALLALLLLLVLGAMLIALRCRHQYGRLLALGIATNLFMYTFVNIAMVTGAIPVGGVPLPLVSHGGSATLTVMFAMGLLLSVRVHRDVAFQDRREEL